MYIGTAGWNVPREFRDCFPEAGSHLERYAARFNAVEINSSFYRPHRASTYARWAATVPDDFQFSVKLPKLITHTKRFVDIKEDLDAFLGQATSLGRKLGPILVQLPPSFAFDPSGAQNFFAELRARFAGQVALEPRHATWFEPVVEQMLRDFHVARVRADPPPVPAAEQAGGHDSFQYHRLHGSPRVYYSAYGDDFLERLARELLTGRSPRWCIFDNTALGFAAGDALKLKRMLASVGAE